MNNTVEKRSFVETLRVFSIPLIVGVFAAVVLANIVGESAYTDVIEAHLFSFSLFGREIAVTPHWLVNDIFMVFFFGIAAVEIVEAMLPGGALNPPSKAVNPLFGTLGGVLGPVAVYFAISYLIGGDHTAAINKGWGIPTATDIALAWLVARIVFGESHPAVNFLLLLAVADDAIGLGIIAIFYPDPNHPVEAIWLLLTAAGMAVAYLLRRMKVDNWLLYIGVAGVISWLGLLRGGLHPALALVFIIPFLPSEYLGAKKGQAGGPLHDYSENVGFPVDMGLILFGLANAGVAVGSAGAATWVVFFALLIGKPVGIGGMAALGNAIGFKYPTGMSFRHAVTAGVVAALGLTVALFVAGQAFAGPDIALQPAAKLGALLTVFIAPIAIIVGKLLKVKELADE